MAAQAARDPYSDVAYQKEPSRVYSIWPVQILGLLLLIVITAFVAIGTRSPWAAVGLLPIAWNTLALYRHVTCDEQGLIIQYWLVPAQRILWEEIRDVHISSREGICSLRVYGFRLWSNISFYVARPDSARAARGEADVLLKTILVRGKLTYKWRIPLIGVAYGRGSDI